jgi:hypothetical protein
MYARRILYAALSLLCLAASASADIRIKARSSFGGQQGPETTTYIKGKRQRAELPGQMATVTQCDLRRTVQLNGTTRTFMVSPFDDGAAAETATNAPAPRTQSAARRGGVITTTVTSTDTGERKQMFGYTARRIKTTMVTESSPDSCNPQRMRMESDGWYIDLNVGFDCQERAASAYRYPAQAGGCQDTHRMKQAGTARTGYPVHVTTTMFDESGRETSFTQEVVEISKATLDAALFEVPSDYREVRSAAEMYSAGAAANSGADDADTNDAEDTNNADNADDASNAGRPAADSRPAAGAGPKRAGASRSGEDSNSNSSPARLPRPSSARPRGLRLPGF